jgi:exosortase C (VPDSG-CTERM-specific)
MATQDEIAEVASSVTDRSSYFAMPNGASGRWRFYGFICFLAAIIVVLAPQLFQLFTAAFGNDLSSYIVLIPGVSLYVLYLERNNLAREYTSSVSWAIAPLLGATIALICVNTRSWHRPLSLNDASALYASAFVCLVWAGAFLFLGTKWFWAAAFPMLFLAFVVPLPDRAVEWIENSLRLASADAAAFFLWVTGMPAVRDGTLFQLPGINLEVAQECSGIKSTWVLFITSVVAGFFFLSKQPSRLLLTAAVIPLGILRNGFRIMVIGQLCVNVDPDMIHSVIHRRGGPLFFVLSLIPLTLIVWLLRRRETHGQLFRKRTKGHATS